jgi:hypothetical protein
MTFPFKTANSRPARFAALSLCLLVVVLFSSVAAYCQATTTVQNGGIPNAAVPQVVSNYTIPRGGIVLSGTALNAAGQPVRHLWVGDNTLGLCRVDPDLDTPGIRVINPNTCPFKLNGQSVAAGPLAYDSITKFLYMADVRRSQGIFRLKYDPAADSGNGNLDLTSLFAMAGNPTGARFQGGQTGCQFPSISPAASVALGPDGNLYATLAKGGSIFRINNPAAATSTGFGSCSDFLQTVAVSPDGKTTGDLAFIGHDLWSIDGTSPFVITNADTTCQAFTPGMATSCPAVNALAAVGAANTTGSDQVYPQLNGNNLYFGLSAVVVAPPLAPGNVFWVADAQGAQIIDPTFINPADIAASLSAVFPPPNPLPLGAMGESAVDYSDPANLVVYTGDDPSNNGITIVPAIGSAPGLGLGRWWQTCQGTPPVVPAPFSTNVLAVNNCPTPVATAIPGAPTVARAKATGTIVAVSWSAAQSFQPVTSYRVRTFANAAFLSDTIISAPLGGFPATTTNIGPLGIGPTYTFRVSAINGIGESGFSPISNSIVLPGIDPPGIPTQATATSADRAAFVTWVAPTAPIASPITSYTVTAILANTRTAITSVVAAPATSAVVTGLTNGSSYTFSVHATNAGGNSLESTPSNAITPAVIAALSGTMGGPTTLATTPVRVTYPITVTNNGVLAVTAAKIVDTLTTTDGAFIVLAQPTQGSCTAGAVGVTSVTCTLGTLAPGATAQVNVLVQIQGLGVTNTAHITAVDNAAVTISVAPDPSVVTAPPPPPVVVVSAAVSVTGNAQVPVPNVNQAGNIVWTISNTTQNAAQNIVFQTSVPSTGAANMQLNSITVTENNSGVFVCTFTPNVGPAVPCASAPVGTGGGLIQVTTAALGGSTKNGAKPPQTLIVTVNVTNPAGTARGTVFTSTGTMTFGPGATDTLPNSATVRITSN